MTLDKVVLTRLLQHACGATYTVSDYRTVRVGVEYAVVVARLTRPPGRVVVKLAGPGASIACPFDRTAAIIELVRARTDVTTPEVLAADVSYRAWPWRYLVTTCLSGTTWIALRPRLDEAALHSARRELGQAVAALHSIRFPAYGEIGADGVVAEGASCLAALAARAERRVADAEHAALFRAVLAERAELFAGVEGAALTHEDLNPGNILVQRRGGRLRLALLDFDSAWAGNPESDLARLELWGLADDAFREAYDAVRPAAAGYAQRRPIYQLLWCLEYARPSPRHLADTARVCAELGIAPITFA